MRKLAIIALISLLCVPLMAQEGPEKAIEGKAEVKAWVLLGSQARELQRLLTQFNEQLATLLGEYRVELKKVYPDMPDNAEFSFETYSFQLPIKESSITEEFLKEKKDAEPKQREKKK